MEESKLNELVTLMDQSVAGIVGNDTLEGFARAIKLAGAVEQLRGLLTAEVMVPIMKLQGTKLGFRTDKDKKSDGSKGSGYPVEVVRDCLIEAVFLGVEPTGNHFNIISGGCYLTKDGLGHALKKIPGLWYEITASLPRIKDSSAAIVMRIEWSIDGSGKQVKELDIPVRVNNGQGSDAVGGKAMRKARYWLYNQITGTELPEGDTQDIDFTTVKTTVSQAVTAEDLFILMAEKRERLTDEEKIHADRIISTSETASFAKLKAKLERV